jgi:hypothetical protein
VVDSLVGRSAEYRDLAEGIANAVGIAALTDIQQNFILKSRGGIGEDGVHWAPLKPETIARRRVGAGETDPAILERRKLVRREYGKAFRRYTLSHDPEQAASMARRTAELKATAATKRSKVDTLGSRSVEILRDTGILLNSLQPGDMIGDIYRKPVDEQIFTVGAGHVTVGTMVPYAATHNYGDPARNIPARPFIPERVPERWLDGWIEVVKDGLDEAIRLATERGNS